jgi:hypothetical protein
MREGLAQWDYVAAAYAVGVLGTVLLVVWALRAMRLAERRRDEARGR